MATATARRRTRYADTRATYGNVAYDLASAAPARELEWGGREVLQPRPKARPKERAAARPKVRVREAGHVSVFAVVGFLAVGVFACLLLLSYVQLTVANDAVVTLKQELKTLQSDEAKLQAQYEMAYDLSTIEQKVTADGSMVKPQSGQIFTLDLSEPDSVVRYEQTGAAEAAGDLLSSAEGFFQRILAYFQ